MVPTRQGMNDAPHVVNAPHMKSGIAPFPAFHLVEEVHVQRETWRPNKILVSFSFDSHIWMSARKAAQCRLFCGACQRAEWMH